MEKILHIICPVGSGLASENEIEQLEYEDFLRLHINLLENYLEVINAGMLKYRKFVYAPLRVINEIESIQTIAESFVLVNTSGRITAGLIMENALNEGKKTANIITHSNLIGFDAAAIRKIGNLLDLDYEVAVVNESVNGKLIAAGINTPLSEELISAVRNNIAPDDFIRNDIDPDAALFILRHGLMVKSREDLGRLYQFLSLKESIPYCGNIYHERFTELFVDYKHIL
ncbi:MAG: hypothetical protein HUU43_07895 [Ignavibacteriaceae bacterium]|nr:hypothetical protein [Ignavibacteriaceae bacterium]NUM70755.1 hypothetical protein [Ignavibacteriaceae bacterium]